MAVPVVTAPSRAAAPPPRERRSRLWTALAAPGIIWLAAFFIFPLYVVLCIVFGQVDPIFRTPVPVWNPLEWDPTQFLRESTAPRNPFAILVLNHPINENVIEVLQRNGECKRQSH